ncbi:hypothetical protein JTE90_022492 [Oedothorax gibbosus]|uniref:Uncharacterized protein n=1 Tax=Oedothorax gibbosus TaxID=931172 RepID=A0AAV6V103_9ARAC|nr:hypothetical protein JTE90_022492 [Oedothorax gibbosus]
MRLNILYLLLITTMLLVLGDCRPRTFTRPDASEIARLAQQLQDPESRQMGILGFTALGAMMFPILVSLGMASFVSHLPTVFKELASEFGIPATPPRNFFFFRKLFNQRNAYDARLEDILNNFQRRYSEFPEANENYLKFAYGRNRR